MLNNDSKRPVHYPANPLKFEFDDEVAGIFQDMAERSIPMYNEARHLTIKTVLPKIYEAQENRRQFNILDIGASTGQFYKDLWAQLGLEYDQPIPYVHCAAIDPSKPMVSKIRETLPHVHVSEGDASTIQYTTMKFDVVVLAYVLQFMPIESRFQFLQQVHTLMNTSGLLLLSQKVRSPIPFEDLFRRQYKAFRVSKGYSVEEIDAKTLALKGSMWTQYYATILRDLEDVGFNSVTELCAWLQFKTCIVEK